jgi:short-chain Z-isoprenyl diphosphate synthase
MNEVAPIPSGAFDVMARWNPSLTRLRAVTAPLYRLYEFRLRDEVRRRPVPQHVGIILDGNRRFARLRGLDNVAEAYRLGAGKLDDILEWCAEMPIPTVTLFVLSTDNFRRPAAERSAILAALEAKLRQLTSAPRPAGVGVRVRAVGRLDLLPDHTIEVIRDAESATSTNRAMTLQIAVAYGGRQEIADAVRALLQDKSKAGQSLEEIIDGLTEEGLRQYLYAPEVPDPDLIIRTSGEARLSGFLLWQSAYSEFYFCDVPWPAFRKIDFLRALRAFQQRDRRFGG